MPNTHFLESHFGKRIKVPVLNKDLKVGSRVEWLVDRHRPDKYKPFYATGRVVKLYETTFGGSKRKSAAKVFVGSKYLAAYPGRKHTTVAVDKLKLVG